MENNLDIQLLHEVKPNSAIILFHGLTGSPFEMRKMAKKLHCEGYDVYCNSLIGHGTSSINIRNVKWQDWDKQVCELVCSLNCSYENIFVSGLCLGAVLALNVAYKYPQIVKGIATLSSTLFLDGWALPFYKMLIPIGVHTIIRYFYTFPEGEPYGIKNQAVRKKIKLLRQGNKTAMDNYPLCCVYELLKLSSVVQKNLKKIKSPILIIHAKEDDLASTKSAKIIYNKVSSKSKEYVELTNSYHLIVLDSEKEFVFNKTTEFFKNCEKMSNEAINV